MTTTSVGMRCPECSAQKTEVRTLRSTERGAVVTQTIVGLNVLAYLAELATGGSIGGIGGTIYEQGALFGPAVSQLHEYWRLVTSGFLHAGFLHLAFNMWILWVAGQLLEPALGSLKFGVLYFVSLLAGSFGALLVAPDTPTIGASGAVFGVMAGGLIVLRGHGFDPLRSGLGITLILNLVLTFTIPHISVGAHIGGMIGGFLSGWLFIEFRKNVHSEALPLILNVVVAALCVAGSIAVA